MIQNNTYKLFIKSVLERYHKVEDTSVDALFAISKIQHLKKGTQLLPVGKTSKHSHILFKGAIVSYYLNKDGSLYHKNIFLEGDFVGSKVSTLNNAPSRFALEVIEEAILITYNYKKYRELIDANLDLKDFYIAYLEKNWVLDKEKREIEIVMKSTKERYLNFITTHPNIETRIPLHYIASHLGVTPTQLSRIRNDLKKSANNQHM
ncbi:Crp/Fnr family transcriptional regulator [Lacinutrix chionoecetis]